ncbi:MAG: hypothetical protein LBI61_02740 [Puniceicoccales bacterium]|jgi:chloramphenicol O-acetyltransferase type B|nr:hypothetical protein [Puniceicoccales bacterium]
MPGTTAVGHSTIAQCSWMGLTTPRPIGKRFSDGDIEKLLQIKWWYWDLETIGRYLPLLRSRDVRCAE